MDQRFDDRGIAAGAVERDLDCQHLRVLRGVLDQLHDRIEAFVGMMQEHILFAHHLENIGVRRQARIARRLKDAILQFRERIIRHQRRQMRHRSRTVEPVEIGLRQIEKLEQQFAKILWTIRFHFQTDGIAAAGTPQLLLDAAEQIFRFFLIDIEIAVARHAKGVHAIQNQTGKKIADVMFDQRREINVFPRFVFALCRGASESDAAKRAAPARWRGAVRRLAAVRARTSRLWLLFKSCGNGWLASTASGVSIGKTSSWK